MSDMRAASIIIALLVTACQKPATMPLMASSPDLGIETKAACSKGYADYKLTDLRKFISKLSSISIAKNEFETLEAYEARLNRALATQGISPDQTYYFAVSLDAAYLSYNADLQALSVQTYAISNHSPNEIALFGPGSSLDRAGIQMPYNLYGSMVLTLEATERSTGAYIGQTVLGATSKVTRKEATHMGIYEGPVPARDATPFGMGDIAFNVSLSAKEAQEIKHSGKALIAMKPKYPFYAEGTKNYDPHLTAPTERTYRYKYAIGDFQCAALATARNKIVDIKPLH